MTVELNPPGSVPRPLDGVRVVDLSNLLMAPYTTQIMGDMGADIVKVEAPEGDPVRGIGPLRNPGMGAIFLHANRSKRSIVLDLKRPAGLQAMKDLLRTADVLVYNRRPQVMARLGLGYETVADLNSRIIYAGLYGYGQGGPYAAKPAFDDLIQAGIGVPHVAHQVYGREPDYVPLAFIDRGVALWAVGQINAALFHQARTGQGQRLDMPMFEMMASLMLGDHMAGETFVPSMGPPGYKRMLAPDRRPFRTADGYVCVLIYTDRHWQAWFDALGRSETTATDPRFASMTARNENIASIYRDLAAELLNRTTDEWLALFEASDIPASRMNSLEDLMADPHLASVGFFRQVEHPSEGMIRDMAVPSTWSRTQPSPTRLAPRLGEQGAEILAEAGYTPDRIAALVADGATVIPE